MGAGNFDFLEKKSLKNFKIYHSFFYFFKIPLTSQSVMYFKTLYTDVVFLTLSLNGSFPMGTANFGYVEKENLKNLKISQFFFNFFKISLTWQPVMNLKLLFCDAVFLTL